MLSRSLMANSRSIHKVIESITNIHSVTRIGPMGFHASKFFISHDNTVFVAKLVIKAQGCFEGPWE